jgi:hypothetical protein
MVLRGSLTGLVTHFKVVRDRILWSWSFDGWGRRASDVSLDHGSCGVLLYLLLYLLRYLLLDLSLILPLNLPLNFPLALLQDLLLVLRLDLLFDLLLNLLLLIDHQRITQ